jgi:hypothetical protein
MSGPVTFTVEELRLEGVPAAHRFAVAEALRAELGRLISEQGVPPRLLAGAAPTVPVVNPTGLGPAEIGRSVAAAIYEGWR